MKDFMTGPSIQVTVHNKGQVDLLDATFAQSDEITDGELCTLFGRIDMKEGNHEIQQWIWPNSTALRRSFKGRDVEWNSSTEKAYQIVWDQLQMGEVEALTIGGWVGFLRDGQCGWLKPDLSVGPERFEEAIVNIRSSFGSIWNGRPLSDIVIPEPWNPASTGK